MGGNNSLNDALVPRDGVFVVAVQCHDFGPQGLEDFHSLRIGGILLGSFFNFFSLQEFDLKIALELNGKPRQDGSIIILVRKQKLHIISYRFRFVDLGGIVLDLQWFVVVDIGFNPLPYRLRFSRVPQIQKANGTNIRAIRMFQQKRHLLFRTSQGQKPQEQTKSCRRVSVGTYTQRARLRQPIEKVERHNTDEHTEALLLTARNQSLDPNRPQKY